MDENIKELEKDFKHDVEMLKSLLTAHLSGNKARQKKEALRIISSLKGNYEDLLGNLETQQAREEPHDPLEGDFIVHADGEVMPFEDGAEDDPEDVNFHYQLRLLQLHGTAFRDDDTAVEASRWMRIYNILVRLACEFNEDRLPGGEWGVRFVVDPENGHYWTISSTACNLANSSENLFDSEESARTAARFLNKKYEEDPENFQHPGA